MPKPPHRTTSPPGRAASPPDRVRDAAVRILCAVEAGGRCDALFDERAPGLPDARDRRFLRQLVAGTVKWRDRLDHILAHFASRPLADLSAPVRQILRLGVYQLLWLDRVPERAAVHSAVELAKAHERAGAGGFVNAILRRVVAEGAAVPYPAPQDDPEGYLAVFYSHPRWLVSRWRQRWGHAATVALLTANNAAPDLCVRRLRDAAAADDETAAVPPAYEPRPVAGYPGAVELGAPEGFFADAAFTAGGWFAQDPSAGLAAQLLAPGVGTRVLDVCAAPGGKTLQLAGATGSGGRVFAGDLSAARLAQVRDHLRRLGVRHVRLLVEDGSRPAATGAFDAVLVDAPCSGTGVLARHPEARWRKRAEDLPRHAERQLALLEAAFARLRPGGALVYSTCSLEEEENDAVVDRFLARHEDARLEPASARFGRQPWAARSVQTLPGRDVGDGAFAARLVRADGGRR